MLLIFYIILVKVQATWLIEKRELHGRRFSRALIRFYLWKQYFQARLGMLRSENGLILALGSQLSNQVGLLLIVYKTSFSINSNLWACVSKKRPSNFEAASAVSPWPRPSAGYVPPGPTIFAESWCWASGNAASSNGTATCSCSWRGLPAPDTCEQSCKSFDTNIKEEKGRK